MRSSDRQRRLLVLWLSGAAVLLLLCAGCTGPAPGPGPGPDTNWILTGYARDGTMVPALPGPPVTLRFAAGGTLSGSAGCNLYSAPYRLSGERISAGPVTATEMYCGGPGVMDQESAFLSLLQKADTFSMSGDQLTLSDSNRTAILRFSREMPEAPLPLAGTEWTLDSLYSGDTVSSAITGTPVTAVFGSDGRVTGSAGCNQYFAEYEEAAPSLSIGPAGAPKMFCTGPGIMEQENTYLLRLGEVRSFSISGDHLTLSNGEGRPLLSFTGGKVAG